MQRRAFFAAAASSVAAALGVCRDRRLRITDSASIRRDSMARANVGVSAADMSSRPVAAYHAAPQDATGFRRSLGVVDLFRESDPRAVMRTLNVGRTFVIVPEASAEVTTPADLVSRLRSFAQLCAEEGVDLDLRVMARRPLDAARRSRFNNRLLQALDASMPALRSVAIENEINNERYWDAPLEAYEEHLNSLRSVVAGFSSNIPVVGFGPASLAYIWAVSQQNLAAGRENEALALYAAGTERRAEPRVRNGRELDALLREPRCVRAIASVHMYLRPEFSGQRYQLHYYEPWYTLTPVMAWIREQAARPLQIDAWELGFAWVRTRADLSLMERELIAFVGSAIATGVEGMTYLPLVSQRARLGEPERWLGLRNPDGSDRPVVNTFAQLSAVLREEHTRTVERGTVNVVRITPAASGSQTVLAWPSSPAGTVTFVSGRASEWDGSHWAEPVAGTSGSRFARLLHGEDIVVN